MFGVKMCIDTCCISGIEYLFITHERNAIFKLYHSLFDIVKCMDDLLTLILSYILQILFSAPAMCKLCYKITAKCYKYQWNKSSE